MTDGRSLERLPMTMGYFRLILRCFGDTPARRRAILENTGVSDKQLRDPAAEITLFQQVRQIENVTRERGADWPLTAPDLWHHSSHGALGTAALTAPTLGAAFKILERYVHIRAPYCRATSHVSKKTHTLRLDLAVAVDEARWRPMMEVSFIGIRSLISAVLSRPPDEAIYKFACKAPDHADKLRAALGGEVHYGAPNAAIIVPVPWLATESPYADAALHRTAVAELERAVTRTENPIRLSARVERLLYTMPDGRLSAEHAARALGVSRRTLVRRLSDAGWRFRDLLDGELKRRAAKLLKTRVPHAEIAERLGYADPTSFSRACRRWFNETPRRKRQIARL